LGSWSFGDKIIDKTDCAPFTWTVVIPVKVLAHAKSRLAVLAGPRRAEMALAFAGDTVSAVLAVPIVARVVVVTADSVVRRELSALGAVVVQDTTTSLNDALQLGATGLSTGVAGLTADLPALRPGELARALGHIQRGPAFVPDADGVGTTARCTAAGHVTGTRVTARPSSGWTTSPDYAGTWTRQRTCWPPSPSASARVPLR
jgi:2-phospho-L-lactate guanylyltransferase